MRKSGAVSLCESPSHRSAPPPPCGAALSAKVLAKSSTLAAAITRKAPPPSPAAVFATKREPWITADDCAELTVMAPPASAELREKVEFVMVADA